MSFWETVLQPYRARAKLEAQGRQQAMGLLYGSPEERIQKAYGLLGEAPEAYQLSPDEQFADEQIPGLQTAGSGLLGSDMGIGARMKFRLGMLGTGYNPQQIQSVMAPAMAQENNYLGFENRNQYLTAERGLRAEAQKNLAPVKESVQYYNETAAIRGGDVNKWSGADDFRAMRNFLKQSLPNESVMGDDLANLRLASGGLPGWAQAWVARLLGKGEQGVEARKDLLYAMNESARTRQERGSEIRDFYTQAAQGSGFDPSRVMMEPQAIRPLPVWEDPEQTNEAYSAPGTVHETSSGVKYKILK